MKQLINLAVAVLLGATVFASPARAQDRELVCPEGSQCWQNQTYASAFDCIVRRGGKAYETADGKPYCTGLDGLANKRLGSGAFHGNGCWLDLDNRGAGRTCASPRGELYGGAFPALDNGCYPGESASADVWVHVHPRINEADNYGAFGLTKKDAKWLAYCRRERDTTPALAGDLRPDPLSVNLMVCLEGTRAVIRNYEGNAVGSCEPAAEGEMRLNGLPMGLRVWHPSRKLKNTIKVEKYCKGGSIPVSAKLQGSARLKTTCVCPPETHRWTLLDGFRYCVITDEGHHKIGGDHRNIIPGWRAWEPELKKLQRRN